MGEASACRVLLIEEGAAAAPLDAAAFAPGFTVARVDSLAAAVLELRLDPPDCVLLALELKGDDMGRAVRSLREYLPCAALVALAPGSDHVAARAAIRAGADDCLENDALDARRLNRAIELAGERSAARSRLMTLALRDLLTGLANRTQFQDALGRAVARAARSGLVLALLHVDLDDFKSINNGYGYEVGDSILKAVAARLAAQVRLGDTLARIGGDEFALILENVGSHEAAAAVGRKLLGALAPAIAVGDETHRVLASIGIAFQPADGDSSDELILSADLAMHAAKHRGGGRIGSFSGLLLDPAPGIDAPRARLLAAGQRLPVLYPAPAPTADPALV